jgi:hypothetical protein
LAGADLQLTDDAGATAMSLASVAWDVSQGKNTAPSAVVQMQQMAASLQPKPEPSVSPHSHPHAPHVRDSASDWPLHAAELESSRAAPSPGSQPAATPTATAKPLSLRDSAHHHHHHLTAVESSRRTAEGCTAATLSPPSRQPSGGSLRASTSGGSLHDGSTRSAGGEKEPLSAGAKHGRYDHLLRSSLDLPGRFSGRANTRRIAAESGVDGSPLSFSLYHSHPFLRRCRRSSGRSMKEFVGALFGRKRTPSIGFAGNAGNTHTSPVEGSPVPYDLSDSSSGPSDDELPAAARDGDSPPRRAHARDNFQSGRTPAFGWQA